MLHHRLLIQLLHFPAQQTPQLGADDFLLIRPGSATRCSGVVACRYGLFAVRCRCFGGAFGNGLSLLDTRGRKALLAVDSFDRALETAEELLGPEKSGREVDGIGEFVDLCTSSVEIKGRGRCNKRTIFQDLVKVLQVLHDDIPMLLKYGQCDKKMKVAAQEICPQALPQSKYICPQEFALVPDKQHAEEEEEVGRVGTLEMKVKSWI